MMTTNKYLELVISQGIQGVQCIVKVKLRLRLNMNQKILKWWKMKV